MPRFWLIALGLLLPFTSSVVCAGASVNAAGDDVELEALMAFLNEETNLATQTKMNADFVPGMITVLHGDQLKSQGLNTVAEALNQVPGFYTTVENAGDIRAIVRGAGAALEASNLKVLVDGVALNRPVNASADWALRVPLSQVDRIEVIRGPGSALYGEFAFSGVVNIITRRDNAVAARVGRHDYGQADVLVNHAFANGVELQMNASGWDRNRSGMQTNPDNFATSGHGYSPSDIWDQERGHLLFANLTYQGYRLQLQHADMERGAGYGQNAALSLALDPRVETATSIELSKDWQLADELNLGMSAGQLSTRVEEAAYLPIPKGIDPPGPPPLTLVDQYKQQGTKDLNQHARINLRWTGLDSHTLFVQTGYSHSQVDSGFRRIFTLASETDAASSDLVRETDIAERRLLSFTAQDQWQISPALELTLGARYDDYDDWGSHYSPRAAAVWRATDKHIFKLQYAEAFRPPTLAELYPGPSAILGVSYGRLDEEQLDSTEASYIYRAADHSLRATVFTSHIDDLIEFHITPGRRPEWRNLGSVDSKGVELEWQQNLGRNWRWFANASYVKAKDPLDQDTRLLGSVARLGNLGIIWNSDAQVSHALNLRYVGAQEGWELQTRTPPTERFDAYTLLDYTLTVQRLFALRNVQLLMGARNLTNEHYATVATPSQYPQGLPNGERSLWMEVEYRF